MLVNSLLRLHIFWHIFTLEVRKDTVSSCPLEGKKKTLIIKTYRSFSFATSFYSFFAEFGVVPPNTGALLSVWQGLSFTEMEGALPASIFHALSYSDQLSEWGPLCQAQWFNSYIEATICARRWIVVIVYFFLFDTHATVIWIKQITTFKTVINLFTSSYLGS